MKIVKHTCPFTGGEFKIVAQDGYPAFKFAHALTGDEYTASIVDGHITIPVEAFEPIECVTMYQAAKILNLSKQQVSNLIKSGKLQAVKFNGRFRIVRESVETYNAMTRGRKW